YGRGSLEGLAVSMQSKGNSTLTPTLSPGERENISSVIRQPLNGDWIQCAQRRLPLPGERVGVRAELIFNYMLRLRGADGTGVAGSAFGPVAQAVDVLVHRFSERYGLAEGNQNVVGSQFLSGIEGIIKCAVNCFLDFGAAKIGAGFGESDQLKLFG